MIHKDGRSIWVEVRATHIEEQGKPAILMSVMDISERKQKEEALQKAHDKLQMRVNKCTTDLARINKKLQVEMAERKQTEEKLREIEEKHNVYFENINDVIYSLDRDFRFLSVSPSIERILGYKPQELIGRPFPDMNLLSSDSLETALSNTLRVLGGEETSSSVYEFIAKDGTRKFGEVSAAPLIRNDKVIALVAVARDITQRKLAEEALYKAHEQLEKRVHERTAELEKANEALQAGIIERKEAVEELKNSEERLKILFEFAPDAYYLNDLKGYFVDGNRAAEEMIGYKKTELIGKSFLKLNLISMKEILKAGKLLAKNALGKPTGPDEFALNRKDGYKIPVEISTFPVKIKGKTMILGIARDISKRKRTEAELLHAKEAAESANLTKSRFLANISHELRTPLNAIIGFTELVVDKNFGDLTQAQEEYLNNVLQSSRHLLSLINDVLDISKIEANKLKLFLLEFNLNDLLLGSLVMVKENAKKHGIKLSTNINKIPETIKADERHLKQIIYNLLSNAVKFTPDGGAVILAARHLSFNNSHLVTQDGQEIVSPVTDNQEPITNGNFVLISVEDTGIGLKAGDLGRVFKPFEQVDSSLGRRYEGTGLGLALTKHLVELHGGRIWTESKGKDKGSKFSFIIPV